MINFRNPTFEKSLLALAHPASLAAAALLLVNDQILKRFWPSWWTGKISDAAWLVVTPFVLAALISVLAPLRGRPALRARYVYVLSFLATAGSFTLVKTISVINIMATRIMAIFLGTKPALTLDPSDLVALPALAISVWVWRSAGMETRATRGIQGWGSRAAGKDTRSTRPETPSRMPVRGILALPLVAVVLLADAAAPDTGIVCFQHAGGKIIGDAGYLSYISSDGGLHWEKGQPGVPVACSAKPSAPGGWEQVDGPKENLVYRYQTSQEIQLSTNGGATWQTGMKLRPVSEQEQLFVVKTRGGNPMYASGPTGALADPASGNMLFAMGWQGVLVHSPSGTWIWGEGAGAYQPLENFPDAAAFDALLGGMVYMAAALALLTYATLALRWTRHAIRLVVLALAWLGWLILDGVFPPATMTNYGSTISALGLLVVLVLILPLAVEQTFRLARRAPRRLTLLLAVSLAGGVLYFFPYVLWLYQRLAFPVASLIAVILGLAALGGGLLALRKEPRKPVSGPQSPAPVG